MSPTNDSPGFWIQLPIATQKIITSRFNDPRNYSHAPHKKQLHEGTDFHALDGAGRPVAVLAAQRGEVDKVANFPEGYGLYVRIRHRWPDGGVYVTWYGHMSEIFVEKGQFVVAGQELGIAGDTGFSSGIHLHLTLQHIGHGLTGYVVDDVVDPEPFLRAGAPPALKECLYVADETVPDGTVFQPGQSFPKTWRVRNSGTRPWEDGDVLAFSSEERMGGPESVPLPPLQPGEVGLVTVRLTAPSSPGRYRSVWRPRERSGALFNFDLFADIAVAAPTQADDAAFLEDVTVPDGTVMRPGQTFLKRWRVRNTGTSAWREGYQLAHFHDDPMGAPQALALPFTRSGEEAEIAVSLTAPPTPGPQRSTWRLRAPDGTLFGPLLFTVIQVREEAETAERIDQLSYVDDVTFEDGTPVQPGQRMEKIWRVRNTGTTTWGEGYQLVFSEGERMGGPERIPLPSAAPGETVDISLTLTAPERAGLHRSVWMAQEPDGQVFPFELFTEVTVVETATAGDELDDAKFVADVTVPDGTTQLAGSAFLKTWRVRNTGSSTWGEGYHLAFFGDERMDGPDRVPLPMAAPGQEVDVSVRLKAPLTPGTHKSTWRARDPEGTFFGHRYFALITVPEPLADRNLRDGARLIEHERVPLGSEHPGGQRLTKTWRVRNIGTSTWGDGYTLTFVSGNRLGAPESVPVPRAEPQRTVRLEVPLVTPAEPGEYRAEWKLRDPRGAVFGPRLHVSVVVVP